MRLREGRDIRPGEAAEKVPELPGCVNDGCRESNELFGKERQATRPAVWSNIVDGEDAMVLPGWPRRSP